MGKETDRDPDKTTRQLTGWLNKKLPEAQEILVQNLKAPEATGFSSDTLMFDLHISTNGKTEKKKLVARLKPTGDYNIFPIYDISQQFNVMRILSDTDIPVPDMMWLEEDESVLGVPFYVMEFVEGRIPTDMPPYHTDGWIPELSPLQRRDLWFNGLETMARIHTLDWQKLGLGFLDQTETGQTQIAQHLYYYDAFFSWGMMGKEHPVCAKALAWLHAHQPEGPEPVFLCWGDSRIANMIFQDQKCMAVIDWEMVRLGNPEEDLAWWIWMDRCFSDGLGTPRLEGFPNRDETVDRWEKLTGFRVKHLEYYELWAAFRFSLMMARVGISMKHAGQLPEDSDFDINNFASNLLEKML